MKLLELFSGTSSVGNVFKSHGCDVFTVDWESSFEPDLVCDVEYLNASTIFDAFGRPDVIWASPDCTTYSIAAISKHRYSKDGLLYPKSEYAIKCDRVNVHLLELIRELDPVYWFIENPRGGMRKAHFMQGLQRYTVTYCQYGDFRMKPTDIWTNHPNPQFLPPCKNGDPCHERAPRGSKRGTQKLKNRETRSQIPNALCEHIYNICQLNS